MKNLACLVGMVLWLVACGSDDAAPSTGDGDGTGDGDTTAPGGDGDSGDGDTTGPTGDGDMTGPSGDGDTTGPTGDGDMTGPSGDGDTTGPTGDGDMTGPGDGDMTGPTGDGDMTGPTGDGDTTGPVGDGDNTGGVTRCVAPTPAQTYGNSCPSGNPAALKVTEIASGLGRLVYVTAAPGDATRLFAVVRNGDIKIIDMTGATPSVKATAFLHIDVSTDNGANTERGLLGMAFHPDFPDDPRFYVNYNALSGGLSTFVKEYKVSSGNPDQADPNSAKDITSFFQPQGNHNGGMLAFGPDGCLYVGTGDGGNSNDVGDGHADGGNGQSLATQLGKILRFDVDAPNTAPPGNMTGNNVDPSIWDYGIRNAWRFSFDRDSGDLYIGDVGQGTREEVDVAPAGHGNFNWGWPKTEGFFCRLGGTNCDGMDLEPPVDDYPRSVGDCIIGGYVYRGSAIPSLQGWYLFADNGTNAVRAFVWDGQGRCGDKTIDLTAQIGDNVQGDITSFGEDDAGELYLTTIDGYVYRIDAQ